MFFLIDTLIFKYLFDKAVSGKENSINTYLVSIFPYIDGTTRCHLVGKIA